MGSDYSLPVLPYGYKDLEPAISEEQLRLHHEKHHAAYVASANLLLEKLGIKNATDYKSLLKAFSFNIGGHVLHSLFWENLAPPENKSGKEPSGRLGEAVKKDFGGFEEMKNALKDTALTVEGSGWAALTYCRLAGRLLPMQIEKHNFNLFPDYPILLVIDVFEHAYYLDYKNERGKYLDALMGIIDWQAVSRRYDALFY